MSSWVGLTVWVAPKALDVSSLAFERSTATIGCAPASAAPWTLFKPTPPVPITTTALPAGTRAVLTTAPSPVMTPQASKAAHSKGTSSGMGTTWDCSTTTYSAKAPVRRPW